MTRRLFTSLGAAAAAAPAGEPANPAIQKAMKAVRAAIPVAESDPARPVYHFRPPAQWNNDPNGTLFYKGWHHLFYQHNPFEAKWGHMHWGHARSRDLVNWEHLPIALWPSLEQGEEHVFSGGAILGADGRPRLFYTSIGKRDPEQWMAVPEDDELIVWRKHPRNPVLTLKSHGGVETADWRDPFLFREGGAVYMVVGGNNNGRRAGGGGTVYLYQALNAELTEWKFRGPVFEYRSRQVLNIECPNLFRLGDKWVLLISPHRPCEYFVGSLDLARGRFLPETHGVLDPGSCYASNISFDERGRCILWLWGRTATDPNKGWNSCMVMPRVLTVGSDGYLRQNPAPEFETLRGEPVAAPAADLANKALSLAGVAGDCFEIEAGFSLKNAATVGLRLAGLTVTYSGGTVSAGGVSTTAGRRKTLRLRVYRDKRVAEVYIDDGVAAIFTTVEEGKDRAAEVFAEGGAARIESLRAWPLKPAAFRLAGFRV